MTHYIIGIDPGVSGAIAVLDDELRPILLEDMPVMARGKKRQVNGAALRELLGSHLFELDKDEPVVVGRICGHTNAVAFLEDVHTMPKQGVASQGSFMRAAGVVDGVLAALGIPLILVTPQAWKKQYCLLGKEKDDARTMAIRLFPGITSHLLRKMDCGRADALLIARWGVKNEWQCKPEVLR